MIRDQANERLVIQQAQVGKLFAHCPRPAGWLARAASRRADQPSRRPGVMHSNERPLQPLHPESVQERVGPSPQTETEETLPRWNKPLPPCSIESPVESGLPAHAPSRAPSQVRRLSPAFRLQILPTHPPRSVLAMKTSDPNQSPNHGDVSELCKPKTNKEAIKALINAIQRPSALDD